ncbi:MAG: hypothetical protein [Caudoviricetes sp.]|nr:MAG: hypothetical protein [Caudoviricetes sp.]
MNLTKKYIQNPNAFAGSNDIITVYEHENGEQAVINFGDFEAPNSVLVHFESGKSVSVEVVGSTFKVATNDDFRSRDFSEHSGMKSNPALLLKIYVRQSTSRYLTENEMTFLYEAIKSI